MKQTFAAVEQTTVVAAGRPRKQPDGSRAPASAARRPRAQPNGRGRCRTPARGLPDAIRVPAKPLSPTRRELAPPHRFPWSLRTWNACQKPGSAGERQRRLPVFNPTDGSTLVRQLILLPETLHSRLACGNLDVWHVKRRTPKHVYQFDSMCLRCFFGGNGTSIMVSLVLPPSHVMQLTPGSSCDAWPLE